MDNKNLINSEKNKFKRAWIWFWYNDITRLFVVMIPSYMILVIPIFHLIGILPEHMDEAVMATYIVVFLWAMCDNDYTNLYRIGMTPYRRKISGVQNDI